MYTRTTTISDLLTADGKRISKDIYQVSSKRMSVTPSSTAYEWPNVPEPSRNEKNLWQTTIKIILGVTRATLEVEQDTGGSHGTWNIRNLRYGMSHLIDLHYTKNIQKINKVYGEEYQ